MDAKQFQANLTSIVPATDGSHILALHELVDISQNVAGNPPTILAVFEYLERYHHADLGSPGPLVHYIEQAYPAYIDALLLSLARRPVAYTLWMANRILNSEIDNILRQRLIGALVLAASHPLADENERRDALEFLQRHNS